MSILDQVASGGTIPDSYDFSGDVAPDYGGAESQMADAQSLLNERAQALALQSAGPAVPSFTVKTDAQGRTTYDVSLNEHAAQYIQQMMGIAQSTVDASNKLADQLSAKRDVLEKYPALVQLGRVAAGGALAYQQPYSRGGGLVRGAGAAAYDYLKDTPESLQAQIVATEQNKMRAVAPVEAALQAEQRTQALSTKQADLEETRRKRELGTNMKQLLIQAGNGVQIPAGTAAETAAAFGATKDEQGAYEAQVQAAQQGYAAKQSAASAKTAADHQAALTENLAYQAKLERQRLRINAEEGYDPKLVQKDNQLRKFEDEYGKLQKGASDGINDLNHWAGIMQATGVQGFSSNMTPEEEAKKLDQVFRSGNNIRIIDADGNVTKTTLPSIIASATGVNPSLVDMKTIESTRKEINSAYDNFTTYNTRKPQIEAMHEVVRKSMPSADQIPALAPGGYVPKPAVQGPPAPAAQPAAAPAAAAPSAPAAKPLRTATDGHGNVVALVNGRWVPIPKQ